MKIFGLNIINTSKKDFLKEICSLNDKKIIFTPNPEILLDAKNDKFFKKTLEKADFLIPDGIGLYIAFQILSSKHRTLTPLCKHHPCKYHPLTPSLVRRGNMIIFQLLLLPYYFFNLFFRRKYLYKKYGERICGSDLTNYLVKYAEKNNIEIAIVDLYVGGEENNIGDILKKCSQKVFKKRLKKKFPKLKFDYFIYKKEKQEEIINKIKHSDSKILFSTLGMKIQEKSVIEIMKKCDNIKLGLGVGSSFDYIIGFQKRAPQFLRNLGLEWLYRLLTGPGKINRLKRLWNAIFVFTWAIIINK